MIEHARPLTEISLGGFDLPALVLSSGWVEGESLAQGTLVEPRSPVTGGDDARGKFCEGS